MGGDGQKKVFKRWEMSVFPFDTEKLKIPLISSLSVSLSFSRSLSFARSLSRTLSSCFLWAYVILHLGQYTSRTRLPAHEESHQVSLSPTHPLSLSTKKLTPLLDSEALVIETEPRFMPPLRRASSKTPLSVERRAAFIGGLPWLH